MTFKEAPGDSSSGGTTHCALNSREGKTSTQLPLSLNAVNLIAPFIQSDKKKFMCGLRCVLQPFNCSRNTN